MQYHSIITTKYRKSFVIILYSIKKIMIYSKYHTTNYTTNALSNIT